MNLQRTHPETWGPYSYYTEQTKDSPLVAYMRQDAQGHVQHVLNVNDIQSNSGLINVGQVKIAPTQQLVAYTLDTTSRGESYEARVHKIGGTDVLHQVCASDTLLNQSACCGKAQAVIVSAASGLHACELHCSPSDLRGQP